MSLPIIVEFVGMMGSGKSTITRLVIQELKQRGYRCPSQEKIVSWMTKSGFRNLSTSLGIVEKLKYYSKLSYLLAIFRCPIIAFKSYRYALSVQPQNRKSWQRSRAPINWMEIFKKYTRNDLYDVIVFEEAVVQYSNDVPIHGKQYSKSAQKKLISSILMGQENHLVIFTKVDADTAIERIKGRAAESHLKKMLSWEFENETEDVQKQKATHAIDIFESTAGHLKTLIPHSLIELDCLKDPKENADLVVTSIEKLLKYRRNS